MLEAARTRVRAVDDLGFIDERPVAETIYYFPDTPMRGDVDNIVKPILDGMKSAVYPDDKVVERVLVQKFEPGIERDFRRCRSNWQLRWLMSLQLCTFAWTTI